jgi:hypothetical protein
VDKHLNVFLPYELPGRHEDQLTRAAVIVMRAVPLARDALLGRVDAPSSARLPEPELDIQAASVTARPADAPGGEAAPELRELVSVFLSPDEGLDLSAERVADWAGGQRLDGVLRFGSELVVVIESKITGHAPTAQAWQLGLHGVQPEVSRVVALGWHELLGDWWALLERGLLAPAERVLMEDLFALAEEHFAHLLPFTTLGRAGSHDLRLRRRLAALLREATGLDGAQPGHDPQPSATVRLDTAAGTVSTQRITLWQQDEDLQLTSWPAELKPQAAALYRAGRAQRLLDFLAQHRGTWQAAPNVHLAYYTAAPGQRLYLTCGLDVADYIRRWTEGDLAMVGSYSAAQVRQDLWPWLRDHQYARPADDLDAFLDRLGSRPALLRPGIRIWRTWPWPDAVRFDERGKLAGEVRAAVTELLTALDEPMPPACTGTMP